MKLIFAILLIALSVFILITVIMLCLHDWTHTITAVGILLALASFAWGFKWIYEDAFKNDR
ncbi:MAG: hypothetical protein LBE91_08120 [Tannerella sp.]|nr:hypothetical protein [Tannerella sp.]